jgi:hypothetical protein
MAQPGTAQAWNLVSVMQITYAREDSLYPSGFPGSNPGLGVFFPAAVAQPGNAFASNSILETESEFPNGSFGSNPNGGVLFINFINKTYIL